MSATTNIPNDLDRVHGLTEELREARAILFDVLDEADQALNGEAAVMDPQEAGYDEMGEAMLLDEALRTMCREVLDLGRDVVAWSSE